MKLFEDDKSYRFRDLEFKGVVNSRADLKQKQKYGFPKGHLLSPRDRQFSGKELNDHIDAAPTTQAEFAARYPDRQISKPDIPKKKTKKAMRNRTTKRR